MLKLMQKLLFLQIEQFFALFLGTVAYRFELNEFHKKQNSKGHLSLSI
jgi:hypothetical protein